MLNHVVLMGRLTRDPELRKTASGTSVASFTIASDESRKNADGSKNTVFLNCTMFSQRAESFVKFFRKGSLVIVEGRITQRKYVRPSDNVQVTTTELTVENWEFGGDRPAGAPENGQSVSASEPGFNQSVPEDRGNMDSIDIVDDDLPFGL